jgi:hypothetical protein
VSAAIEQLAALRELVATIAEIAAPSFPAIGPDPDVTHGHIEEFRDLQRDRAHQVASAARHVTLFDPGPDVIRSFAWDLRSRAGQPSYPVAPEDGAE